MDDPQLVERSWYYATRNNERVGPVSIIQIAKAYGDAVVNDSSLGWRPGLQTWTPLGQLDDLQFGLVRYHMLNNGTDASSTPTDPPSVGTKRQRDPPPQSTDTAAAPKDSATTSKRRRKQERKQFPDVYMTGLPTDVTEEEVHKFAKRAGMLRLDAETLRPKIRLYRDKETGALKGDAMVGYMLPESVPLALQFLDQSEIRTGFTVTVERRRARTAAPPTEGKEGAGGQKGRRKNKKAAKSRIDFLRFQRERAFTWDDSELDMLESVRRLRAEKGAKSQGMVVVFQNVFDPAVFRDEAEAERAYATIRRDMASEVAKVCGDIKRVFVFKRSPKGAVAIRFRNPSSASVCVDRFHQRWYDGRQLRCAYWDGTTDFRVPESTSNHTVKDEAQREKEWADWLNAQGGDGAGDSGNPAGEQSTPASQDTSHDTSQPTSHDTSQQASKQT